MRPYAFLLLPAILAGVLAGSAAPGAAAPAGPGAAAPAGPAAAPAAPAPAAPVYVWNLYGAEQGRAARRPARLTLSEHTPLHDLAWRRWGRAAAVGTGRVLGTWCLPRCTEEPYPATVRLTRPVRHKGRRYFTRYVVTAPTLSRAERSAADLKGALPVP